MRYPTKKYSQRFVAFGFIGMFMAGLLLGVLIAKGPNKVIDREEADVRSQVKFLPIPDVMKLKTETVLWIDPGWRAIGIWQGRLVLTMQEPPWMRDP